MTRGASGKVIKRGEDVCAAWQSKYKIEFIFLNQIIKNLIPLYKEKGLSIEQDEVA